MPYAGGQGVRLPLLESNICRMKAGRCALPKADVYKRQALYGVNLLDQFEKSYQLAERYGAKFMQVDSVAGHLSPCLLYTSRCV